MLKIKYTNWVKITSEISTKLILIMFIHNSKNNGDKNLKFFSNINNTFLYRFDKFWNHFWHDYKPLKMYSFFNIYIHFWSFYQD